MNIMSSNQVTQVAIPKPEQASIIVENRAQSDISIEVESLGLRWQLEQVEALFALPFNDLLFRAQTVHRQNFDANELQ